MGQTYTGEDQATEGSGSKFAGVRSDKGDGSSEFVAIAAGTRETVNSKVQAPLKTELSTAAGAGATIGSTGDAAIEGDTSGSLSGKLRGLGKILGTITDTKVITDAAGSISGKLRGLVHFAERIDAVLGLTSDVALAPDNSGSISAKIRSLTKILGATDDAAVSTDANGTVSAKLRGIIVNLLTLIGHVSRGSTGTYATPVTINSTATLIRSAAATRKGVGITVTFTSSSPVYLGYDSTVTAGASGKNFAALYPGDSYSDESYVGALYGIVDSGGSAAVKYAEVTQ